MFDYVPDMAAKRAELSGASIAFREHETGRTWNFQDVNRAANGVSRGLTELGIQYGARVAILCQNCPEFFAILFACQKAGFILCPLNWRQPVSELVETLDDFAPTAVIYDTGFAETGQAVARKLGAKALAFENEIAHWLANGADGAVEAIPATRPWYLLFTSGTTGSPKAVIQTAGMCWANATNIGQAVQLTARDTSVNFLPLFHTAGINLYTLPVFLMGGKSTILPRFDAEGLLTLLKSGAVTQFFGVPAIYQSFSLSKAIDDVDWSRIRCGCGGAPLAEPLIREFAARGARVLNGFGMTETGPTVFLMDEENAEAKIGSVGKPQMLTECRLVNADATPSDTGEIQLRGPNITPGYFENASATEAAFTADGWLKTGDVGRRDADGYMYIVDRIKDMYISGGENVYPAEVERVLDTHPDILEAAVIGVPDPKWGETGKAFVLPRPDHKIDPDALRAWCRERLAAYKVPAKIEVVEDFPRTAAGKIRKPDLRKGATGD